jgi:hypothetical protein
VNSPGETRMHESDDQLELYALDRLYNSDLVRVENHLIVCEECRERLEQTAAFAFAVREALKQDPKLAKQVAGAPAKSWLGWLDLSSFSIAWKPQFALAAFAVIILATSAYFLGTRPGAGRNLAPLASLQLTAMRGGMQSIPASKELDLTVTDSPASGAPFRVEIVDASGGAQWTGTPESGAKGLTAHVTRPFPPGTYFARLYDSSGKLLHEYGFRAVSQ